MFHSHRLRGLFLLLCGLGFVGIASGQETPLDVAEKEVRASADNFVKLFNTGKAEDLANSFFKKGELIDEEGTSYQGQESLKELFATFFEKFPGAQLATEIDSIRTLGDNIAIEEGTRLISTQDGTSTAQLRYVAVHMKGESGWQLASVREFNADPDLTPYDRLQSLAWLVGEWVNEGSDGVVKITYRWSEDKNYLLGDFLIKDEGKEQTQSTHRIGWDPVAQKVRSWLFDSDGGFSEGVWTPTETGWLVKSTSVIADGRTGSATIHWLPQDADHFTLRGSDRVVGDSTEPDFEVIVGKRPKAGSPSAEQTPAESAKGK